MKKKSSAQLRDEVASARRISVCAFFNVRVLIGLFVFLAGIFLALLGLGTFSSVFAQNGTTREQMTLALAQALAIQPPPCVPGQEMFHDVPASNPFCPFIEELVRRGITGGCGSGNYCPSAPVSRAQMAAFLLKTLDAAKNRFAVVNSNGTLARGRGVVSTQHLAPAGQYEVIFDTNTTGCAYIGNVGSPGDGAPVGFLTTALRSGTTNGVFVLTFNAVGAPPANNNFHLELVCP
jgi:hypothetical protein